MTAPVAVAPPSPLPVPPTDSTPHVGQTYTCPTCSCRVASLLAGCPRWVCRRADLDYDAALTRLADI